jgi:L-threonylcarbamoyladenylate synthase
MATKYFIADLLRDGGMGIIPTDTIYAIAGSALKQKTVERIYSLRKRNLKKPMIVLINSLEDIKLFGIKIAPADKKVLEKVWPGKVSVILPFVPSSTAVKKFKYLHRGTNSIAFRLPRHPWLRALLKQTGPLVAPSANFEGEPPAKTIRAAQTYFGADADFYADAGRLSSKPSTVIALRDGNVAVIRRGAVAL